MSNERRLNARVPSALAEAIEARADATGLRVADVMRSALVREVVRPADALSRAFVEAWLAGADVEGAESAEGV